MEKNTTCLISGGRTCCAWNENFCSKIPRITESLRTDTRAWHDQADWSSKHHHNTESYRTQRFCMSGSISKCPSKWFWVFSDILESPDKDQENKQNALHTYPSQKINANLGVSPYQRNREEQCVRNSIFICKMSLSAPCRLPWNHVLHPRLCGF